MLRHITLVSNTIKLTSNQIGSEFRTAVKLSTSSFSSRTISTGTENEAKEFNDPKKSGNELLKRKVLPAVIVGATAVATTSLALPALGFCSGGIAAGSIAATWMASYGGTVPLGSILAILQSAGTGIGVAGNVGIFSSTSFASYGLIDKFSQRKQKVKPDTEKPDGVMANLQSAGAVGIGVAGNVFIFASVTLASYRILERRSRIRQKSKLGDETDRDKGKI